MEFDRLTVFRSERVKRALLVLLFLTTPLLVFPWRFVRSGLLDGGDDALSNLPLLRHSAEQLLSLEVLWTPALWLGTPLLEEPEFATFYLPRLVLLLFEPISGFALYVILHYALAQAAMFLLLRVLGLGRPAAVFAALVYGFVGFMIGHRGHTMYLVAGAWAPLFFFFVERARHRVGRYDYLWAALSFAALPLSGALQLTAYLGSAALLVNGV
ncbi:MAG TPA: hypothetical protein VK524_04800, partial [Polyangiaceae bacterium]|nr:hypothetical protein [Polyangiaceae bacterium]